ncbi:hypothetical protein FOA52_015147 [Chlamydomonas sp. UWO 241]|nr:hypothetical protein FOA52_015147 [Chlamydomonas sp. UWO 241]
MESANAVFDYQGFRFSELPPAVLLDILVRAGAWPMVAGQPLREENRVQEYRNMPVFSALSVCREFRAALMGSPEYMVAMISDAVGGSRETALEWACRMGHEAAVLYVLDLPHAPRADGLHGSGCFFTRAAFGGHESIVRLLLEAPAHAARADASNGAALRAASEQGYAHVVRLLLEAPSHAARANCMGGAPLDLASQRGHELIVRMLLDSPHPPRADLNGGKALAYASSGGHSSIVDLLEKWEAAQQARRRFTGRVAAAEAGTLRGGWSLLTGC